MATGQTLLDTMEMLDQELQLQSGEVDVTRGLLALNRAQDYFESLVAQEVKLLGDSIGTVTTTVSTESTAWPSTLLRLDRLQLINPATSRPYGWDLENLEEAGAHAARSWPASLWTTSASGAPQAYWTDGSNIYWSPLPDATHTVRWYGFASAADITASGTFAYKDFCILPFASVACAIMRTGIGDDTSELQSLMAATLSPVVKTLSNFVRDGAHPFAYTRVHTT